MEAEKILAELGIQEEVLAIFPYGSRVYGTATADSDHDYIIVTKGALLASGAFRDNAISNEDRSIQAVLYSRSGFINAINEYEIGALECLSLDPEKVILKKWPFKVQKWDVKELAKKIIQKSSASWHIAEMDAKQRYHFSAKKGMWHALRILDFGIQLKNFGKITQYDSCNDILKSLMGIPDDDFDTRDFILMRDNLHKQLRS